MRGEAWFCEGPDHEGDRRVHLRTARYTKRVTYMRADGAERLHERSVMRLCRPCVELDAGATDPNQPVLF